MNLKEILSGIEELKAKGNIEVEINNIQTDSRKVAQGDLFVAIKGFEIHKRCNCKRSISDINK